MLALAACAACLGLSFVVPAGARAAEQPAATQPGSGIPAWAYGSSVHRPGFHLSPRQAIDVAKSSIRVEQKLAKLPGLVPVALPDGKGDWDVYFIRGTSEPLLAVVTDRTGRLSQVWTGWQVKWEMARGYPGAFGKIINAWFVWIPLCLLFLLPFFDPREPFRLLHLDLMMLLAFSISQYFFNRGQITVSVPLVYPVLLYLGARALFAGFRPSRPRSRLVPIVPVRFLFAGLIALVVIGVVLNVVDSNVVDVGDAGVLGARDILHGHGLYTGLLGSQLTGGDTYGPVNYLAYIPFVGLLPSAHGGLDAAHGAAIAFNLLTLAGLLLLGRRWRHGRAGTELGVAMAFAWASYPYTLLVMNSNMNDALVAALLVWTLIAVSSPVKRGIGLSLATLAKLFPLALVPLFATGCGPRTKRSWVRFAVAFGVTSLVFVVPFIPPGGLHALYSHTIGNQLGRQSPFSVWGQHTILKPVQYLLEACTLALGLAVGFRPRTRTPMQVAALAAALLILFEITLTHWFYSYILWFAPLLIAALFSEAATGARQQEDAGIEAVPTLAPVEPEPALALPS